MEYTINIPIGDWSNDGHGICPMFPVISNKSVEAVREAHFKIKDVTGIHIEDICSEYGDSEVDAPTVADLKELGFIFEGNENDACVRIDAEEMLALWMFLLQKADPTLKLRRTHVSIPMLSFYGYDSKGRHIGFVGYGLFE